MFKKVLLSIISLGLLVGSTFAYTLNSTDKILVQKLTQKVENVIESKGESFRGKFIKVLNTYAIKYKSEKPRYAEIFLGVAENLEDEKIIPQKEGEPFFFYKKGDTIWKYNIEKQEKEEILKLEGISHFDVYENKIVYAQDQEGYEGNSDIFIYNINEEKTTRITENNNIASYTPYFIDNGKKITYIRRSHTNGDLSWGSIRVIDSSGNIDSSYKLIEATYNPEHFTDAEEDCWKEINEEYIGLVKMNVKNDKIEYQVVNGGGGYMCIYTQTERMDHQGNEFFTDSFKKDNTFGSNDGGKIKREVNSIVPMPSEGFIVNNSAPMPISYFSILAYSKDQKRIASLYDESEGNNTSRDKYIKVIDLTTNDESELISISVVRGRETGTEYILHNININGNLLDDVLQGKTITIKNNRLEELKEIYFVNGYVVYLTNEQENNDLFIRNPQTEESEKIEGGVTKIEK